MAHQDDALGACFVLTGEDTDAFGARIYYLDTFIEFALSGWKRFTDWI